MYIYTWRTSQDGDDTDGYNDDDMDDNGDDIEVGCDDMGVDGDCDYKVFYSFIYFYFLGGIWVIVR